MAARGGTHLRAADRRAGPGPSRCRGEPIDGLRTDQIVKRGIGVVPEGRRIFPKMTVEENLRMGAFAEWGSPVVASQLEQIFDRFPRLKERRRRVAAPR